MKIQLLHLSVDNFKGLDYISMDFSGQSCTVYGDNATGKTSLYDALLWLLFDKDSQGQANFEIKPLGPDGQIKDHAAITSVAATLSVDGQAMTFRRELREVWATRRGGSEAFFEGNSSDYFVDGVPLKKAEFVRRLSEIVQEDTFRLLTSVSHFCAELPWKDRRQVLFDVCGSMPEREILMQAPQFSALAAAAGALSVDDLKRKLAAERKGLAGVRDDIPARLDECQKTVEDLQNIDFADIRAERDSLTARRDKLTAELVKLEHNSLLDAKVNERDALQNQLAALEAENLAFRARQTVPNSTRSKLDQERATLVDRVAAWTSDQESTLQSANGYAAEIDRLRAAWSAESTRTYTCGACPTCGQTLAGPALQSAVDRFEEEKKTRLTAIVRESEIIKGKLAHEQDRASDLAARIGAATNRLGEIDAQTADLHHQEQATVADMEDYTTSHPQLMAKITAVEVEISRLAGDGQAVCETVHREIGALTEAIQAVDGTLAKETVFAYTKTRTTELRTQAAEAAAQLERLDNLLNQIDEFTRHKVRFIEENVNAHFKLARFRLFTEQINGGLADCCEVVYDGVPFGSLNNGARINVGIDVIETLSTHYGVSVPLFVDNAESVTQLHGIDTQMIRLQVSEADKDLRCETWA